MPGRPWLAAGGVATGILVQPALAPGTVALLALGAAIALGLRRRIALTVGAVFALAVCAGSLSALVHRSDGAALRARAETFPRCALEGTVVEQAGGLGTLIAVTAADCAPPERAMVIASRSDLAPGTRVSATGWLSPLGDDGFEGGRAATGADAELVVEELHSHGITGAPHRAAEAFRRGLSDATDHLDRDRRGLVRGMAIGDTSELSPVTMEQLRRAGLTHLLAVSGSNVAIVIGMVAVALRNVALHLRLAACGTSLAFYILVVGPDPSVLRAGAMGAIALLALWRGVQSQTFNLLGLALTILLLVRPGLLDSPGLHLSAAATAGIVVWANRLAGRFERLPRPVALALGATLAAQIAVAPVLLATFGEVSLVAPLANVLAFPVVAPITVLGLGAGALAVVAPGPAGLLASTISPLAGWVADVGRISGSAPWASATIPTWSALPVAVVVLEAARRTLRRPSGKADPGPRDDAGMGDYLWTLNDASGRKLRVTETFESQPAAEAWLGGEWQSLADEGAESVSLMRGDEVVYTMGLGAE